ncbi:MAG TPA: 5-formyltetrahydrofolate cyclo-ligase [Spirochaetia bacterium]|nr:5-formyltetrahydrofolate cyclo-ligase [Spirochaetia bacterium]
MESDIKARKKALRRDMKAWLCSLSPEEIQLKSESVSNHVRALQAWGKATVLFSFMAMEKEVSTKSLNSEAVQAGKAVYVPRIAGSEIEFCPLVDGGSLFAVNSFGILEPEADTPPVDLSSLGGEDILVLVPGLAFDSANRRLGRGKGYYDRFLSRLIQVNAASLLLSGVCFHGQVVPEVPVSEGDIRVNIVITEDGPVPRSWGKA